MEFAYALPKLDAQSFPAPNNDRSCVISRARKNPEDEGCGCFAAQQKLSDTSFIHGGWPRGWLCSSALACIACAVIVCCNMLCLSAAGVCVL